MGKLCIIIKTYRGEKKMKNIIKRIHAVSQKRVF